MSRMWQSKVARRRRRQASVWALRLRQGPLAPRRQIRFDAWQANEENKQALAEAQRVWYDLRAVLVSRCEAPEPLRPKAFRRITWMHMAAVLGVIAILGTLAVALHSWARQAPRVAQVQVIEAHQAAVFDYPLADRSVVDLRPGSRLHFEMSDAQRLAHMPQGEIFFTVAPDVQRPFVVKVAEGYISAVGTAFAVRLNAGAPSVVVREGIVAVKREADAEATLVRAGQQLEMVRNGGLAVRPVDIKKELAWTRRLVNFSGQTIGEAVRTFNRHNKLQIEIADARIAGEILNLGEFYLDDPEWFVTTLNARVERAGPHTLRLLIRDRHGEGE